MVPEKITFHCSSCGTSLSVPVALAGVEGPCPKCSAPIRAPLLASLTSPQPVQAAAASPHSPPVTAGAPAAAPTPAATRLEAPPSAEAFPRAMSPLADAGSSPRIRPEPRDLPGRQPDGRGPVTPRKTTEDETLRRYPVEKSRRSRQPYRAPSLIRFLVPVCFVAVLFGVIMTVYLASRHRNPPGKPLATMDDEDDRGALYSAVPKTGDKKPVTETKPAVLVEPPPELVLDAGDLPVAPPPAVPIGNIEAALEAEKTLERFLEAPDAETRAALCEPAVNPADLAGTPLAGRLPAYDRIDSDAKREVPTEGFVEYPFAVAMKRDGKDMDYSFVVRKHGDMPPKVFLPAAMDLMGGRLAKFAATPGKEVQTFHVVLEAVHGCYEDGVPDSDRKHTFRLRPGPYKEIIARAYFSQSSRYLDLLADPASELHWGTRVRATVTLQWNRTEDPKRPFLEVTDIKSLNWDS